MRKSKRINPDADSRDEQGRFKKRCCSSIHSFAGGDEETELINLMTKKRIHSSDYNCLLKNGIITCETNFICQNCVTYAVSSNTDCAASSDNLPQPCTTETESENDEDEISLKCHEVGAQLNSIIQEDVLKLFKNPDDVKHLSNLNNYDPRAWLLSRPSELLLLLSNLCQIDINTAKTAKLNLVAKIVELIYYCRNSKLVLPNHFMESLLSYSFTNSKAYSNFLGNRSPGGSYSYLVAWLEQQASDPIKFPSGLTKAIFDNNQKIGRTYVITGTNVVPTSVMTSSLWLTLDQDSQIQEDASFKPSNWMWTNKNEDMEIKLINALTSPGTDFRKARDDFISTCIDVVYNQAAFGKLG